MSSNLDGESKSASSSPQDAPKPQTEPTRFPTIDDIRDHDIWNNCTIRGGVNGVIGGSVGLVMGLFLWALDCPIMHKELTGRQLLMYQAKLMGQRSWSSCKALAVMSFIFTASECTIEKARGKKDIANTAVAGCMTGGAAWARDGPKAACAGCVGFAAFSVVAQKLLEGQLKHPNNTK